MSRYDLVLTDGMAGVLRVLATLAEYGRRHPDLRPMALHALWSGTELAQLWASSVHIGNPHPAAGEQGAQVLLIVQPGFYIYHSLPVPPHMLPATDRRSLCPTSGVCGCFEGCALQ